jgi:protoheme IX farnesyltransferase
LTNLKGDNHIENHTILTHTDSSNIRALKYLARMLYDSLLLMKPGIVLLVVLTGLAGIVYENSLINQPGRILLIISGIALAAGSAGIFNQVWEKDIDLIMDRTKNKRPIPAGKLSSGYAVFLCSITFFLSIVILFLAGSAQSAILGICAIVWYSIYTIWFKRKTSFNVVLGGITGGIAPLIGSAAGSGSISTSSLIMSTIIFLWSPPHFWALALYRKKDYINAGIPMLPVVAGDQQTRIHIALYITALLLATFFWGLYTSQGWFFFTSISIPNLFLLYQTINLLIKKDSKSSYHFFLSSVLYLTILFAIIILFTVI